jgi:hypothetical protein
MVNFAVLRGRNSMRENACAFSRIELAATIVSLALLGIAVLPACASTKSRSRVAQCLNNLRLMGRAVQIWGSEHIDQPPWRTFVADGGTRPETGVKPGLAFYEYYFLSNELATPRILACPADDGVRIASDFGAGIGGYRSAGYRGDATSYILNLHAISEIPGTMLFGDRNLRFDSYGITACNMNVTGVGSINPMSNAAGWTNNVHGSFGNIVTIDGNVMETTSGEFRITIGTSDDNGSAHLLRPR